MSLLSDSRSHPFLSSSFLLPQTLWLALFFLSSCSIRLQWVRGHSFLRGTTGLISWPDGEHYSRPQPSRVVPVLLSLVSTLVFSRTGSVLSHLNSSSQIPSFSTEELVLPRHGRCDLSRDRCNGHSLLLSSYLFRIGRIENPSCSACGHSSQDTSHLILHCPATGSLCRLLLVTLCLCTTSGPSPEEFPGFLGFIVFRHAPSLGRGRVTATR